MENKKKIVTRKDVAEHAGVSVTVVSYVLNNNRYVEQTKRERVLKAVKELNYRPSMVARALKGKRSNHILFIADNISNEYFATIVEEMDKIAYNKGYLISLLAGRNDNDFISQIESRQMDGIVVSSATLQEKYISTLISTGVPVVLLMNRHYTPEVVQNAGKIYTGLEQGVALCVKALKEQGRKNIIYIDRISSRGNFSSMNDLRYKAFCEEMQSSGLTFTDENTITGYTSEETLSAGIREKIEKGLKVDGIVGRNDRLACVALKTVQDMGYNIPKDISIVGFDNSKLSQYIQPALTSVELPRSEIAKEIMQMFEQLENGDVPSTVELKPNFIVRDSL